jgi:hypothetical protein
LEVAVPGEKFTHSMKDLCAELDQRIYKLEQFRDRLEGKISKSIQVGKNSEALSRVSNSLAHARDARSAMESSCCDYSCEYELHEQ